MAHTGRPILRCSPDGRPARARTMTGDEDFAVPGEVVTIAGIEVAVPLPATFDALGKSCSLCDDGRQPCSCGLVE